MTLTALSSDTVPPRSRRLQLNWAWLGLVPFLAFVLLFLIRFCRKLF